MLLIPWLWLNIMLCLAALKLKACVWSRLFLFEVIPVKAVAMEDFGLPIFPLNCDDAFRFLRVTLLALALSSSRLVLTLFWSLWN